MNERLSKILEEKFDHWVLSQDESRVVAWRNYDKAAIVFDTSTATEVVTIEVEMDRWLWAPGGKELISHNYIITCIWDATTGKFLRSVEAMYDRPD
jgi:hypothetical protein